MNLDLDALAFASPVDGLPPLVPVVAQHARDGSVLMMAYADREALERTVADGRLWLFSRSRRRLWRKGESSGNELHVETLTPDCDGDAVLARVRPAGPACHTGARSCFAAAPTLAALADVIDERRVSRADPTTSYTARLLSDRNLRLKKLGEEATELALACAAAESSAHGGGAQVVGEAADLLYHVLVACAAAGVSLDAILDRLDARLGGSAAARAVETAPMRAISSDS